MARTAANLIDEVRRYVRDIPDYDTITASLDSSSTSVTVADATIYRPRWPIEIDYETMMVRTASGTTLTVKRGFAGATTATHASGASILMRPAFYAPEILDALNMGIDACYPYIYKPVQDTSIVATDATYEYTVPNLAGTYPETSFQVPIVTMIESLQPGDLTYRKIERWEIRQAPNGSRKLKLRSPEPVGSVLRLSGYGPYQHLVNTSDTMDVSWPANCQHLPVLYAAGHLLISGEAGRDRYDVGPVDRREEANRTGASLTTGQFLLNRFFSELIKYAMPPIPKHMRQNV